MDHDHSSDYYLIISKFNWCLFNCYWSKRNSYRSKTKQYGKYVYGRILDFVPTGSSINGIPELKAVISAYIPSTREVKEFRETIGFGNNSYNIGDYLVLKHYEDDVNIIQHAVESKIPIDVIEKLDSKISVSEDKSYVIINNKKYVKKQNENDSYQDNW